jgi:hypothetical protein
LNGTRQQRESISCHTELRTGSFRRTRARLRGRKEDAALPVIALSLFTRFRSRIEPGAQGSFAEYCGGVA